MMLFTLLLTSQIFSSFSKAQDENLGRQGALTESGRLLDDKNVNKNVIEPTSPVLGKKLVQMFRYDERHPEIILRELYENHPNIERHLQISAMIYFKTMIEPLRKYCADEHHEKAVVEKEVRVIEQGAIPLAVLEPLQNEYAKNTLLLMAQYDAFDEGRIKEDSRRMADEYQSQRRRCSSVRHIDDMAAKFSKLMLTKKLKRLIALHQEISSPEAAFPRIQFTINGFTGYVYRELMKMDYARLVKLLSLTYEAQKKWLALKQLGGITRSYLSAIEKNLLSAGFLPREILLLMAYSNRNMPSLDVQYAQDARKSLLLEAYFWKSRRHRDIAQSEYVDDLYPNHVMKRNPGVYHYATAALMACDVRLSGYSGVMARVMSLGNKTAYKVHKLLGAVKGDDGHRAGLKAILTEAKRQAFGPGIDAGRYGGKYGLKLCRKYTPKDKWLANHMMKNLQLSKALHDEDLSAETEALLDI